jgi:PAS domain S-box-containing protein
LISLSEQSIIALTAALAHLVLIVYLIFKWRQCLSSPAWLSGYLVLTSLWDFLLFFQESGVIVLVTGQNWQLAPLYLLLLISLSIWSFTQGFLEVEARRYWAYIVSCLVLIGMATVEFGLLPLPATPLTVGHLVFNNQLITILLGSIMVITFLTSALYAALKAQYETYSPRHKNRLQILILSLSLITCGIWFYLSLIPIVQSLGLVIQWLGALILIYIVLSQELPDIYTGLKEFVKFVVVTSMTLLLYGGIIFMLQKVVIGFPYARLAVAMIAAVLLTISYLPLRRLTQHAVERILFRHRYNDEQVIKDYIQAINNILFIKDLVSISLTFIDENLNIKRGAFFLLNHQNDDSYTFDVLSNLNGELPKSVKLKKNTLLTRQLMDQGQSISQYTLDLHSNFRQSDLEGVKALKRMAFEQYVPIKRNHILIGVIALGPFASGAAYTIRDIEIFSTLAAQTAIALENARLFENVRQNLEEITRIKNLLDSVFSSIQSGVITVGTEDNVLMANDAAYHILDLSEPITPGSNIGVVLAQLQDTALPALLRDVKTTQRNYHNYEINTHMNGRGTVNLSVDLGPIRDAQKRLKGVTIVINDLTEMNRLQAVQDMFRTYLSPAVVDRLPSDPAQLKLGGHRQAVSILFADIRGFTTYSEFQQPEDLITILNKYLSIAAEAILAYEGTLDKFMGDAVMAIFNAPLAQEDHALRAVKAAAAMQKKLAKYHQRIGPHAPKLQFGVGIHVGEAVVGNVGTNSRMDYTAIGDAVNLAKRIQENTPGGKILLSQSVFERVRAHIEAVPFKRLTVKGRREPEQTYELIDVLPDLKEAVDLSLAIKSDGAD